MTATGHALVATLIAAKFHNPVVALPLCFVSHFACDMVPHWDEGTHWREKTQRELLVESILDVTMSIVVSVVLYGLLFKQTEYSFLLMCVFASQLPDYLTAPYFVFKRREWWMKWSEWCYQVQRRLNRRLDKPWGIVTTGAAIVLVYIVLFRLF